MWKIPWCFHIQPNYDLYYTTLTEIISSIPINRVPVEKKLASQVIRECIHFVILKCLFPSSEEHCPGPDDFSQFLHSDYNKTLFFSSAFPIISPDLWRLFWINLSFIRVWYRFLLSPILVIVFSWSPFFLMPFPCSVYFLSVYPHISPTTLFCNTLIYVIILWCEKKNHLNLT
jgi:hypothetical protein